MKKFFKVFLGILIFSALMQAGVAYAVKVKIKDPALIQGIEEYRDESFEEAEVSLLKARENDPNSAVAAYYLGLTYKQMLYYEKAAENLEYAITLRPGVKNAIFDLAEMYYHLGRYDDAMVQIERAEAEEVKPAHTAFLKGIVYMKIGDNVRAIEAFDLAKSLDDSLAQSAEYQMGVAYIKLGKLKDAHTIFEEVVIIDPNSDLAMFANQYIGMIKRKAEADRPLKLAASFGYEFDSNVILKPSDQEAAANITGEQDTRFVINFRAELAPKRRGPFGIKAQYSVFFSDHQDINTHDVESHTFTLVGSHTGAKVQTELLTSYNYTKVEHDKYLSTITVAPGVTFAVRPGHLLKFGLGFQNKDYLIPPLSPDEERDAKEYSANVAWIHLFKENSAFFTLRYVFNKEFSDGRNWEYTGNKGVAAISLPLTKSIRVNGSGSAYLQTYDKKHSVFSKDREDIIFTTSVDLSYQLMRKTELHLRGTYIRGDSNIAIYDYDKYIAGTSLEVRY